MTREPGISWHFEQDDPTREIRITMCRHRSERNWSVTIGAQVHPHISTDNLEALIECEVINSVLLLTDQECTETLSLVPRE